MNRPRTALPIILGLAAALLVSSAACSRGSAGGASEVRVARETILTYPFSDPDPVPIFARSSMWGQGDRLYPYSFIGGFSKTGEERPWTVVRLENPYVSVAVLPETGGKVWGATDKSTGRDFIYHNRVMKFREIALRGPWTSGGIEFNFGVVGHAPSTATPVDYLVRTKPDGTAVCYVGTMDLPSRTRWTVAVELPPDAAAFETRAFWHNPTPFSQSYYAWSCAAIHVADDLKYIFPGRWFIGHNYAVPLESWPVDARGRDLSLYANNAFPDSKSYFTVGELADFYGAWSKGADAGFGHWSPYEEMPGRKVWIWDLSRSGGIWVDLLTDADGQYTEPQAGRLLNQSDHDLFPPGRSDRWREVWFPYAGIGPMVQGTSAGALNLSAEGGTLRLGFYPIRPVDGELAVTSGGRELRRERLRLKPSQVFRAELPAPDASAPLEVRLDGVLLYSSDPASRRLERPLSFHGEDDMSAEGRFRAGLANEKQRMYSPALPFYQACLLKEPTHVRALSRVAEIYTRRGEYDVALTYAAKALAVSMYDAEANYVYGVAARRLGRLADARETLGWAARSMEYRAPAYTRLAEIAMERRDPAAAADYASKALAANADDSGALEVLIAAERTRGRTAEARAAVARLLESDPLDHAGRFELYRLDPKDETLRAFTSMVRNEFPAETYLEMAIGYADLGLTDDALALLRLAPGHPEALAWTAWLLRDSAPAESDAALAKAAGASPRFVFPFREESIPVFRWMAAKRPGDWAPKYYLGLILTGKGRSEEAAALFQDCGESPDFAPFYVVRARMRGAADPAAALADYAKAIQADPKEWRARTALVEFHLGRGDAASALEAARAAAEAFPSQMVVQVGLVKALAAAKLWPEAAEAIDRLQTLPFEGASEVHGLFVRTHIRLGLAAMRRGDWTAAIAEFEKSKEYPERLGTGAPFHPDARLQDHFEAVCRDRLGDAPAAAALRRGILDYTLKYWDEPQPHHWFGALALRASGDAARSRELMARCAPPEPDIEAPALESVR